MFDFSRIGEIGRTNRPRPIVAAAVLLAVAIFLLDLVLHTGAAAGVPYVAVVLLTLWLPNRRSRIVAVVATSVLTIAGFFLPPPAYGTAFWIGVENRILTLLTLWATGMLGDLLVRRTEQLEAARKQGIQSERLAAIGQTLAVLSHESNNELNTLKLGLEVVTRLTADRPAMGQSLDAMRTSLDRLTRLFEDIRSYASPIAVEPEPIAVADIWRRAWERIALSRSGRNAELVEDICPSDGASAGASELTCAADAFRLEQVFRNLFENALAACPDPVRIEVCTATDRDGMVIVRVRDNGPGIPGELREQIFEPFFTTKSKGTGLGMSISRRILEAHGGKLELADNQPGTCGAEFILHLPAAAPRA